MGYGRYDGEQVAGSNSNKALKKQAQKEQTALNQRWRAGAGAGAGR